MTLDFELLYNIYTQDFVSLVQNEEFYTEFMNKAKSGNSEVSFMHRFIDKQIDLRWVEAIEEAIIPLDTIIRNPRRFIVQEEEVVNIELARKISPESIRHLAQHTNMIAKVENDTVTPNRILNIFKEESFETYENRFIYTLLINLQYFISKRLAAINESVEGDNVTSILFKDNFKIGKENVKCSFEMTIDSPGFKMEENLLDVDPEKLNKFQRIERIKKILYDFQNSALIKSLTGAPLVRPPIMRTNVLQKDPDFKKAKALWDFIETYRETGFSIEVIETNEVPSDLYLSDLYSTMVLNYSLLKHHIGSEGEYEPQKKRKVITPQLIERTFMDMLDDLTFDIDVIQRIFNEQVAKSTRKRQKQEKEVLAVIDRALKAEQKRRDDIEAARLAALEAERQEKLRIREEQKRKLEAEKLARQQERLEKQRLREEEKRRLEEEKQRREQERLERKLALEKQKEEEKKRKEREKLKLQKQKQALEEKERQRKERERQKLKEKKAKELAAQKEAERKRKEQEKLRQQKEKLALEEKERQRKEKEQQRLKEQKAKELAAQKEAERKRKEQEKLRQQKEKQALEEKERQRKAKEQQKLKEQKAKELAKLKEAEQKRKEAEKLRAQKEKEALAEKERQRKAKEQQKIKEMKAKELAKQKEAEQKRKEREKLRIQKEKQALLEKERLRKEKEKEKLKQQRAKEAALLKEKEAKIRAAEKAKIEALRQKSKAK